jgi:hypothetical protein
MIRVNVITKNGQKVWSNKQTLEEAQAWIAEGSKQQWWGKPAYTEVIPAKKELQEVIIQPKIVEQQEVVVTPEVLDDEGNVITPAITEMQEVVVQEEIKEMQLVEIEPEKTIEHPAEFEVQIEDITAEIEAQKAIDQALKFLSDTDWMVIRQAETGVPVPQEILEQRAQARILISKKREQKKGF